MPETEIKPEQTSGQPISGGASGDSATKKTQSQTTGASEVERAEKQTDDRAAEKKRSFFQARQERKQSLTEDVAALKKEIADLKATREVPRPDGRKSILDTEDPDAYLDSRFDALQKDIEGIKSFRKALEDEHKSVLNYQAEEYILSRKHLQDPQFGEEIRKKLQTDPSLIALSEFDPMRAAKAAYNEVCEARGIAPDFTAQSPAGRASGARPTVPRGTDKQERSFQEWQIYVKEAAPGQPEHATRMEEMRQAHKEGRIR